MRAHGLIHHCYADDTQLYFFCKPSEAAVLKSRVIKYIGYIAEWMSSKLFKLNPAKLEFPSRANARRLHLVDRSHFQLADDDVTPTNCSRRLDAGMNKSTHIGRNASYSFYQLHIRAIRESIVPSTA